MAFYRLSTKTEGKSEKLSQLTDFEHRVWSQYKLSADDYGVMRESAVVLQSDNLYLEHQSASKIRRALRRLVDLKLVLRFEHQGQPYLISPVWQDFQNVRHPVKSTNPLPPPETIAKLSPKTAALVRGDRGSLSEEPPQECRNTSEGFPLHARACVSNANANANASPEGGAGETTPPSQPGATYRTAPLIRGRARDIAFPWRVEVPGPLHSEFIRKLGGDDDAADAKLHAWYLTVADAWDQPVERPIGDDDWTFWRARFREWQGTTKTTVLPTSADPPRPRLKMAAEVKAEQAAREAEREARRLAAQRSAP